jgi:hypothetical protein
MKMSIKTLVTIFFILYLRNTEAQYNSYTANLIYNQTLSNLQFSTMNRVLNRSFARERASRGIKSNNTAPSKIIVSPKKATVNLDFTPTMQTHDQVVTQFAKVLSKGNNAKIKPAKEGLEKADFLGMFNKSLSEYNLNSHNVADVYAAYIIFSWEAITGNDATKYKAGIEKFRDEIRAKMNNGAESNFNNTQKQLASESLAYLSVFNYLSVQELVKKGNAATLNQTRANIAKMTTNIAGIDVIHYTLNDSGFKFR